jgi:PAS domain S-box-containing protein
MPAGVIITDASGTVAKNNEAMDRIWRREMLSTENIENHGYIAYHKDGREYKPEEWPLTRALLDGEKIVGEEMVILRGDGTKGTVHVSSAPIKDKTGKIIAGVVLDVDITDLKHAEEVLRENQTLLRAIMDSATDPVYVKDGESRILLANEALAKVVGKPLEEIIGRTDAEYYGNTTVGQILVSMI